MKDQEQKTELGLGLREAFLFGYDPKTRQSRDDYIPINCSCFKRAEG
jgi:hypothetical protein